MNNIILFKDFYELFLDNLNNQSVTVNTSEYNGIKQVMNSKYNRTVYNSSDEFENMINRLNNNDILNIEINKNMLYYILDNDKKYYNSDAIKYNSVFMRNTFSLYHRWADMPTIDISYEICEKLKRIDIIIAFTTDNRNDGLPDWCFVEISNTYWFNPSGKESIQENLLYLEFMERFKNIIN